MNNNDSTIETLFEKAENYSKTTIELLKLKTIDKSADVASSLVVQIAFFIIVVLFVITLNIGLALWIGELLGKSYYGFFAIAGFYALMAILIRSVLRQSIKITVGDFIIKLMLKQQTP